MSVSLPRELFHIHIDANRWTLGLATHSSTIEDFPRRTSFAMDDAVPNIPLTFTLPKIFRPRGIQRRLRLHSGANFRGRGSGGIYRGRVYCSQSPVRASPARYARRGAIQAGSRSITRRLLPPNELHLTASSEESDPDVLDSLFDMGFFCAYAPKEYGMAQVFTAQGSYRSIAEITPLLVTFIEEGGLARVRLKEERIVRWWASSPAISLPPIIHRIDKMATPALSAQFADH